MKKTISTNLHIPLPSAPAPPKIEPHIDEPSSSCSTALTSPISLANLQGICVYQLPFPGVLSEKDQREKLSAIIKKYTRNFEIRFDAVPNNSPDATQQTGNRRFQPLPLIRRALIVIQKLANCSTLQNELNQLSMVGCQLKASAATTEDLTAFINARTSKPSPLLASKPAAAPPLLQPNNTDFQNKKPQNLLRLPIISPPAAAVKALIFDSQNHGVPDPFSKNASRTLYIKHLDTNINEEELKTRYSKFGYILDIEVKNRNTMAPYAFIQFTNIESVCSAIKQSNQQQIEDTRQKKNSTHHWWGNTLVSNRLWVGLLPSNCGEQYLASKVRVVLTSPEHDITKVDYDPAFNEAVLIFTGHEAAHLVFNKIKTGQIKFQPESSTGSAVQHNFVHVDFCSEKLHSYFVDRLFHKSIDVNDPSGVISSILPSPPEQPKLLTLHSLKKASPSPPPDPSSTGNVEKELPISTNLLATDNLEVNNQQRIDRQSSLFTENIENKQTKVDRNEEKQPRKQSKNKFPNDPIKKKSINKQPEIRRVQSPRRSRSSSTSSKSSMDTYTMPKRKWRDHSQQKSSKEIISSRDYSTNSNIHRHKRKKQWRNQPKDIQQYSKGHKHQQSIEIGKKRNDDRSRDKEGRNKRLKKHESTRKMEERICRDRSKKVESVKKSSESRGDVYHRKTRSKSDARQSSSILPPPPQPPTQMGRIDSSKARDKSTSSCSSITSNTSCSSSYSGSDSCSTCVFNEDVPRRDRKKEGEESSETDESSTSMSEYSNENDMKNKMHLETISISEENEEKEKIVEIANMAAKISVESQKMEEQIEHEGKEEIKLENLTKKMGKAETKKERTNSVSSEIIHKKSDQQNILPNTSSTGERTIRPKCDNLTARLRTLLRSSHVNIPLTNSSETTILCDPRKQKNVEKEENISLEIPRFVLKLKLPKHSSNNQQNENKLTIELKQPKKEESYEDAILLGTPISATPSFYLLQRQEMHLLETTIEQQKKPNREIKEENMAEKQQKHPSISSFTKANLMIKEIFEKINDRKADLELKKIPMKNETNISKIQQELDQLLEVFSGTSINELPILVDRYTSSHRQQQNQSESKIDLDESQDNLLLRPPRPIGSSFSLERTDKQHNEEGNNDCYERRNTLPSHSMEIEASTSSVAKPKTLIPRPRASSSSTSNQDIKQSNEFGSPKMESPIASQKTIGGLAKTKTEKEESNQFASSSTTKQLTMIKKNAPTILKKQITITNQVEIDLNKQTVNTNSSMKIAQQKLTEQKQSSTHQSSLITTKPSIHKNMEKDMVKKDHKDKEMKPKQTTEIKPLTSNFKKMSSSKEEKQRKEMEQPKKAFSVGSKEQMKSAILQQKCEDEFYSDEKQHKRKKKRKHETSSSEEEDEDDETIAGLFDIELEEQKKILEDIKSGKTDGLSMYDRVKRRSSQRPPEDEKKKATVLEQLREKQAKKKKELNRVRLLSTSSDSDGSKESAVLTSTSVVHSTNIHRTTKHTTDHSELDEDIEVDVDDSFSCTSSMQKMDEASMNVAEELHQKPSSISTIRRPEIAPKKPMPTEEMNKDEEDSEAKNFSSSGEWNLTVSSDGDEIEGPSKIGDKLVKKLKMEFDRHRPSSQSSIEEGKHDFEQKLARVVEIAKEGLDGQQKTNHFAIASSDEEHFSSEKSISSSSSGDERQATTLTKGTQIFKKQIQKRPVTNLSLEDVFGEDSDEYESTMEEKEALTKSSQSIQPTKKEEKKIIPILKTKKPAKLAEIKIAETTSEEKNKNKKFNEQLRQKSGSVGGKESNKHLVDSKGMLKRQSPIRSISIDDLHGKQQNKEKQKQKRVEKNLGQIIGTKKLKTAMEELKESQKGIKRQTDAEIGAVCQKRSKLDIPKTISKSSEEKEQKHHKQIKLSMATILSKQEKGIEEDVKTAEINKAESPLKDFKGDGGEIDTIGLLKIVNPVAADEFEVIDSGKVACNTKKVEEMEIVDGNDKKEEERKREEEQAELLRKMEQNEEEEAVAALKLQTNITIRNSQETEENHTNLSSFIKPIEHNWLKKNEIEEPMKITGADMGSENNNEEGMDENKSMVTENMEKSNKNIVHESVERRPSNESLDAQMVGSGFVEIDAEVLKEQQEKEILAEEKRKQEEDEHKKAEEMKRLEATVDFVASSKAIEPNRNFNEIPMQQSQQQIFTPIQTEFVVKAQLNQQENAINSTIIEPKELSNKNPPLKLFIAETSLQQTPIKQQERIGVIVSESQKPTATILEMRIDGTNQHSNQIQASNIFANFQSDQQKTVNQYINTTNTQQQPRQMNPTISDSQMSSKMNSYEGAYNIPTTTLMPNPPFIPPNFEQQQPSKLFIHPQLDIVGENQINQQQNINAHQQKEVEKKLSQQIKQQNLQNQQPIQQHPSSILQQHYPTNSTAQQHYQSKDIQQQMTQQIRKQESTQIGQMPLQQSKQQDLKDLTSVAFPQEQPKQRKQSAILPQIPQQHPTQIPHLHQQQADQFATAAAVASSAGLIDSSQIMQFYQRLMLSGGGDQQSQMLQQNQQMQNLSTAAMMPPNAFAKWHALFPIPTTSAAVSATQNAASMNCSIEDLIRQSALLGSHSSLGMPIPPTTATHLQSGMRMTSSSIEEFYMQQYLPQQNASPHLQQHSTIPLANNPPQQQTEQFQRHNPSQHQPMPQTQIPPVVCSNSTRQNIPHQSQNNATQYQQKLQIIEQQQQKMQKQTVQAATLWQGQLAMKNSDTLVQMHKVCGNEQLIGRMNAELVSLNEQGIPLLRITQRMRLEQSQLESVVRKMEVEENYLSLICFPCGRDRNDVTVQMEKMKKAFIEYFLQKAAAGIASSPPNSCIAHVFAPDNFIKSLLAKNAPDILRKVELCNAGYLFVILTNS